MLLCALIPAIASRLALPRARAVPRAISIAAMSHCYDYPRPAVTVDAVILAAPSGAQPEPKLLLIQRKNEPFQGKWALPGGFVDQGETLDSAAARELQEETSVDPSSVVLTQVGAFGNPGRDPRGWTITVAYAALVPSVDKLNVKAADDAADARWYSLSEIPQLAFDHALVVGTSLRHLAKQPEVVALGDSLLSQLHAAAVKLEGL
mmetsp:Transcript_18084/g.30972  ORF Transcript_18084/g.30972 Transcript_18084/m.30972 type:complete len:206 (+) Transcript_18084:116-733(+)